MGVVRPVNNPLYSLRANKNANACGRGEMRLFDEAAARKKRRGKEALSFFFLPLSYFSPSLCLR